MRKFTVVAAFLATLMLLPVTVSAYSLRSELKAESAVCIDTILVETSGPGSTSVQVLIQGTRADGSSFRTKVFGGGPGFVPMATALPLMYTCIDNLVPIIEDFGAAATMEVETMSDDGTAGYVVFVLGVAGF